MLLNCDLGESFGNWQMGLDELVMPHIDQANIACGFHAGDPLIMQQTIALAKKHDVQIGAHPAYPDLQGFGRRSLQCSSAEIIAFVHYQIAALDGMAKMQDVEISYVKPHGALYNDMMVNKEIRAAIMQAIAEFYRPIALMLQATPEFKQYQQQAKKYDLTLLAEAFADRCYDDDGTLLARTQVDAVHNTDKMLAQVKQLKKDGTVTTINGKNLRLNPDSLCVHGDNMNSVNAIEKIKALLAG
ncbi:MAG: 5-oxoprolinase subunit PxpA [Alteromonadaceae bacterium]|nr:5-oxoprolinase subunit PxpA [Alteromonadaceae bacterium]